jgi:hypothetical protein
LSGVIFTDNPVVIRAGDIILPNTPVVNPAITFIGWGWGIAGVFPPKPIDLNEIASPVPKLRILR